MAIDFRISRKFSDNYVQADISTRDRTRYIKLPESEVDSFYSDYRTYYNKTRTSATILDIGLSLGGALVGIMGGKLAGLKTWQQMIAGIALAFTGNFIGTSMTAKDMVRDEKKLFAKHDATELFYDNKRATVNDIIR